jgi:hypothetical protein
VSSWSWDGFEGKPVTVEVYSDAGEVELIVNGRSLGRAAAGPAQRYTAVFETSFEPGLLEAVAWRGDDALGRVAIRSAKGTVHLDVSVDRGIITADSGDLAFVALALTDADGVVYSSVDQEVMLEVEGPASLQALGSANPRSEEGFAGPSCTTFGGRALAVVRPTGPGRISVTATSEGCAPQHVVIDARG